MNRQYLIDLINKSQNGEIVLICGNIIYYQDKDDNDVEIEVAERDKEEAFKLFNDESVFNVFSDNMQIGIKLKK